MPDNNGAFAARVDVPPDSIMGYQTLPTDLSEGQLHYNSTTGTLHVVCKVDSKVEMVDVSVVSQPEIPSVKYNGIPLAPCVEVDMIPGMLTEYSIHYGTSVSELNKLV